MTSKDGGILKVAPVYPGLLASLSCFDCFFITNPCDSNSADVLRDYTADDVSAYLIQQGIARKAVAAIRKATVTGLFITMEGSKIVYCFLFVTWSHFSQSFRRLIWRRLASTQD